MSNLQGTETSRSVLIGTSSQKINARPTLARRNSPNKNYVSYAHIFHVYSLVSIDTLARMLKAFVTYLYTYQAAL